ncbi:MAG: hypothetical protein KJZ79_06710 [Bryobacteraceae bacterium]|nr:hypothetical protein [Bryobacteraceae bacterium]
MTPAIPPSPDMPRRGQLTSWKQIAHHLNVSERTAQNWELSRSLPVRRMPGPRGRVWADPVELDAWLFSQEQTPIEFEPKPRRTRWPWPALGALLAILLGGGWHLSRTPAPASWRVQGKTIIVNDARDRDLWSFTLQPGQEIFDSTSPRQGWGFGPQFVDLDGDGHLEFLVPVSDPNIKPGSLLCFDVRGQLRWTHILDTTASVPGKSFGGPWLLRSVAPVPRSGAPGHHLITVWSHRSQYPATVQLLDADGGLLRQYWHSGHFGKVIVLPLGAQQRPHVILSGISNGHRVGTLVVLDPQRFTGASREENAAYQILGHPDPVEAARLLFPRSRLNLASDHQYNLPEAMVPEKDGFAVEVVELRPPHEGIPSASLFYDFGPRLDLRGIEPNDGVHVFYGRRVKEANWPADALETDLATLKNLRYLTPWQGE